MMKYGHGVMLSFLIIITYDNKDEQGCFSQLTCVRLLS